ncbi:hypothetical protein UACE39S_05468 [Ureibacillus acetophenoni]
MSLFTMLVANQPLKEVDHTGITEITVGEMKKLYPITENTPEQPWHTMDDDVKLLHAPDESAFGELCISLCKNPPYDLDFYSDKEYIYWIKGNWKEKFLNDFVDYTKTNLHATQNAELLIFWAGDGEQKLKKQSISISEVNVEELEKLRNEQYVRVQFIYCNEE